MLDQEISLSDVAVALKRLRNRLVFEPALEAFYETQTSHRRARILSQVNLSSLPVYNLLVVIDYVLLRGTFAWAVALHLGLVTAISLAVTPIMRARPTFFIRETLAVLPPVLMFAQVMIIYVMNNGEADNNYQYITVLIIILMNSIQRPDFRFALVISVVLASVYCAVIWLIGHLPLSTQVVGTVLMATAVYTTLISRHSMERDARFAFLRRTQDKLQHDAVEALASRDDLTGLFNRRGLDDRIQHLWGPTVDPKSTVAVLMIDVDHFKSFNDRYGHLAGDLCLTRVASAIVAQLSSKDDIAVRFGGEEFLVVLVETDAIEAVRVAERIRRAIETLAIPHECSPVGGSVTASCGVMGGPISTYLAADLIAAADTALYAAKRAGRNRVWPPFVKVESAAAATLIRHAS